MSIISIAFVAVMVSLVLLCVGLLMVAMYQELGALGLLSMPVLMATIFGPLAMPDTAFDSVPSGAIAGGMIAWYLFGITATVFCMQYGQSRKYSKR